MDATIQTSSSAQAGPVERTIKFGWKKDTKNKAVFEEITSDRPIIGSLYVDKYLVGGRKNLVLNIQVS